MQLDKFNLPTFKCNLYLFENTEIMKLFIFLQLKDISSVIRWYLITALFLLVSHPYLNISFINLKFW